MKKSLQFNNIDQNIETNTQEKTSGGIADVLLEWVLDSWKKWRPQ